MTRNVILGILVIVLIGLIFIYTSPTDFKSVEEKPFTAALWKEGDAKIRATMADDLMQSDTLLNLSRQETLELLGNPNMSHVQVYLYNLDFGHSWWPDDDWTYHFTVHFDTAGKVTQAGYSD